jgi:hypothetical protein
VLKRIYLRPGKVKQLGSAVAFLGISGRFCPQEDATQYRHRLHILSDLKFPIHRKFDRRFFIKQIHLGLLMSNNI